MMKLVEPLSDPILKDGQLFGSYRVIRAISEGNFFPFYEAQDTASNQSVLLCPVPPKLRSRVEEFLQQCAPLNHPALPKVIPVGELADGHWILAMVPPRGDSLHELIQKSIEDQKPLGMRGMRILAEVADLFAILHESRVPLLLQTELIAVRFEKDECFISSTSLRVSEMPMVEEHTGNYVWPQREPVDEYNAKVFFFKEQAPEVDVYILGVLGYQCLLGRSLGSSLSYDVLRYSPRAVEHIPLESLEPRLPVGIPALLLRMLRSKPTERPTMRQVRDELYYLLYL